MKEFNFSRAKPVGDKFKGRELKVSVTARLDPQVVAWLRQESENRGLPYQTLMNLILVEKMKGGDNLRQAIREELEQFFSPSRKAGMTPSRATKPKPKK